MWWFELRGGGGTIERGGVRGEQIELRIGSNWRGNEHGGAWVLARGSKKIMNLSRVLQMWNGRRLDTIITLYFLSFSRR